MPTILCAYTNIQSNPMLRKAIECSCQHFFALHRIPFILQMLGSVPHSIDFNQATNNNRSNTIQSIALFRLLIAMEQQDIDNKCDDYSILELVKNDLFESPSNNTTKVYINTGVTLGQRAVVPPKIIRSLDFCYADDDTAFTIVSCFDACATVGKFIEKNNKIFPR